MINVGGSYRRPSRRIHRVAGITRIGGIDMVRGLATGGDTIMAINTISGKGGMIRYTTARAAGCRNPGRRVMTRITFRRGLDMGRPFTGGNHIVVAARTHTQYLSVIYTAWEHRSPGRWPRLMTGVAYIRTVNM